MNFAHGLSTAGRFPVRRKRPNRPAVDNPTPQFITLFSDSAVQGSEATSLHREGQQVTGLERCPCRTARIQRNHIACAFLVWIRLKALARATGRTVYQLKQSLLDEYLTHQLRNPSIPMMLA